MRRMFRRIVLVLAAFIPALAILLGTVGNWEHKSYFAALFMAVLLLAVFGLLLKKSPSFSGWLEKQSPVSVCLLMSAFCLSAC